MQIIVRSLVVILIPFFVILSPALAGRRISLQEVMTTGSFAPPKRGSG